MCVGGIRCGGGTRRGGGTRCLARNKTGGKGNKVGPPPMRPLCDSFAPPPFPGCSVCCKSTWAQLRDICRSEGLRCAALDVTRRNLGEFEVEYLCDYKRVAVSRGAALGGVGGGRPLGGGRGCRERRCDAQCGARMEPGAGGMQ